MALLFKQVGNELQRIPGRRGFVPPVGQGVQLENILIGKAMGVEGSRASKRMHTDSSSFPPKGNFGKPIKLYLNEKVKLMGREENLKGKLKLSNQGNFNKSFGSSRPLARKKTVYFERKL